MKETKIICDKCGKKISEKDWIEFQEAYAIDFTGGYGSVFGDMVHVHVDLCQHCLLELLTPFMKTVEETKTED